MMRVVYAGTPDFATVALRALLDSGHEVVAVYTQPDRPAGRGRKPVASAVKRLTRAHALPLHQPLDLNGEAERQRLAALGADVMVVAAYGLMLPATLLDIPRYGCLNIHASLLPRWRGAAPIQRALLAGDTMTGVTIMQMDAGLDSGAMLHKIATPVAADDTTLALHDRLAGLGAEALLATLAQLEAGGVDPEPQDDRRATYAAKLDKGEAEIDWNRDATTLMRRVNAFNPWPVAQTLWKGKRLRIWQALALDECRGASAVGTVVRSARDGVDVACGEGILRLLRMQRPGGKPLAVADFVNGCDLDGARLG